MAIPELPIPGYELEELLEEDPFGWRYLARHDSGEQRSVKVLKAQATSEEFLCACFDRLMDSGEEMPGAAPIYDYSVDVSENFPVFASPFYGWRSRESPRPQLASLKRLMPRVPTDQAPGLVLDLAQSIASIHRRGVFHGGLRPGCIFLTGDAQGNRNVIVGDFGQILMGGLQYLEAGDLLFYASPEQLETGDFSHDGGARWDVYSFGVIAFQLLTGHLPRLDRLRQQCEKHEQALNSAPAISYGELTPVSEHFLRELAAEMTLEWPSPAADPGEERIRGVIEDCLWYDSDRRIATVEEALERLGGTVSRREGQNQPAGESEPFTEAATVPEDSEPTPREAGESGLLAEELTAPIPPPAQKKPAVAALAIVPHGLVAFFRSRPYLKWQIAAAVAMIALLPATFFAFYNSAKLRATREELTVEAADLQASVEEQAAAYRRVMQDRQKSTEQLRSELDSVEDSKSRLVGEAMLARQILRQTQEKGDEFFRLVLENRDTDVPEFRKQRVNALHQAREHYERLIEVYGDAPDFLVSTANALFYLGRIYREQGEFGKSLASFGEAERRYMALLDDEGTSSVDYVRNLAIAKNALGELSFQNGQYGIARHYFTESSRYWAETRAVAPELAVFAATNIHENSLAIVECEFAINRLDAALDGARSIGAQLLKLQEEGSENDRVVGALAKSFALVGRILEAQGEGELAREAFEQAGNLFAQAVTLNAAVDDYRLGLGNSLARIGMLENDFEKLEKSVDVLKTVVLSNPFEADHQRTLADVYGVLARNQRDGGRPENAANLEREAISILQPIIRANPEAVPSDVLYSYSQRLAHLAELLGDDGEFDDSRAPLREAIVVLERITKADKSVAQYRRALARARGLAGFACLKSGDKGEAREHLELAKSEWETYMAANPDDADAEQAVRWTSDQLRALR